MSHDSLPPDVLSLLGAGREYLGPDAATVVRLRGRIDAVVAGVSTPAASALASKLVPFVVIVAAGTATGVAVRGETPRGAHLMLEVTENADDMDDTNVTVAAYESPFSYAAASSPVATAVPVASSQAQALAPTEPTMASLAREIELVDLATAALRAKDYSAALATLDTYQLETHGEGQLAQDAAAIAIDTLCSSGDPRGKHALVTFQTRWPRSPLVPHLHTTCNWRER